MKSVKTLSPLTLMKKLSKMMTQSNQDNDEDFFYDRIYFMKQNYDNDSSTYKSNDVEHIAMVMDYDLETINILIQQVLRFGRIVYSSDKSDVYNFPKNELPKFYIKDIFSRRKTHLSATCDPR